MSSSIESLISQEYQHGFVTDIEADTLPAGLSEEVVRAISARLGLMMPMCSQSEAEPGPPLKKNVTGRVAAFSPSRVYEI